MRRKLTFYCFHGNQKDNGSLILETRQYSISIASNTLLTLPKCFQTYLVLLSITFFKKSFIATPSKWVNPIYFIFYFFINAEEEIEEGITLGLLGHLKKKLKFMNIPPGYWDCLLKEQNNKLQKTVGQIKETFFA